MATNRYSAPDHGPDCFDHFPAPFQFHHCGSALFNQPLRIFQGRFRGVIAPIGHIGHQQGTPGTPAGETGVVNHIPHTDRECIRRSLKYHSQGIAHQHHIHACVIEDPCKTRIIGGQGGDLFTRSLHQYQSVDGNFRVHAQPGLK